ncbi:hypothetical protein BDF19DRAFT_410759 [Syncephalis fuscata]|nr:hypothetical protein BDF19DRAFT_410759 [Syncephalis fuscata]
MLSDLQWFGRLASVCLLMATIISSQVDAQTCMRPSIRREIRKLSRGDQDRFFNAVLELKRRRDGDLSIYDRFVQVHLDNTDIAHGVPSFLPWHRKFIRDFELALQRVDSSVSLPYWDWSLDSQSPEQSPIFSDEMYGGNGEGDDNCVSNGRFANWSVFVPERRCLQRSFNEKADIAALYAPEALLSIQQDENTFEGFWNSMEGPPHGVVHMGIGGDMGSMTSPNDPLFWVHHSFMDKMWADWQIARPEVRLAMYGGHDDDNDREALPNDRMSPWGLPVRAVLNHRVLCYNYDTGSYDDSIASARRRLLGIITTPRSSSGTSTPPFRFSPNDSMHGSRNSVPLPPSLRSGRRPVLPGTWVPGRPTPGGRLSSPRVGNFERSLPPSLTMPNESIMSERPPRSNMRSMFNRPRGPIRNFSSRSIPESLDFWDEPNMNNNHNEENTNRRSNDQRNDNDFFPSNRQPFESRNTAETDDVENDDDLLAELDEVRLVRRSTPSDTAAATAAYNNNNSNSTNNSGTALMDSHLLSIDQLTAIANQKASNTKKQINIQATDRDNLVGLRQPRPLPDWWIKMNKLSANRVRKEEAKLRRVINDVNQLTGYLSPSSLVERIRSGDLLAPVKLLGDVTKETLTIVEDVTKNMPIVGDTINDAGKTLSNTVDTLIPGLDSPNNIKNESKNEIVDTLASSVGTSTDTDADTLAAKPTNGLLSSLGLALNLF